MRTILISFGAATLLLFAQLSRAADVAMTLEPKSGSNVQGKLRISEAPRGVRITGEVRGLAEGQHGLHVHAVGDCSARDATSAGEHFNPSHMQHGGLKAQERHAGDLGNIQADASGVAKVDITGTGLSLAGDRPDSIRGRALVVHAQRDDEKSDPAGNSGPRVACGVIAR